MAHHSPHISLSFMIFFIKNSILKKKLNFAEIISGIIIFICWKKCWKL